MQWRTDSFEERAHGDVWWWEVWSCPTLSLRGWSGERRPMGTGWWVPSETQGIAVIFSIDYITLLSCQLSFVSIS